MKLRTKKFSSEGLGGNSANFCTNENFPLYGILYKRTNTNTVPSTEVKSDILN